MKKVVNGALVEMTAEEMAQIPNHFPQMPETKPTLEERLDILEQLFRKWIKV